MLEDGDATSENSYIYMQTTLVVVNVLTTGYEILILMQDPVGLSYRDISALYHYQASNEASRRQASRSA